MKIKALVRAGIILTVFAFTLLPVFSPQGAVAADKPIKLKFQASWPAGSTLYGNFVQFCDRAREVSAGRLDIEPLPAGTIVGALEVLDAASRRVIDGAHSWPSYWFGKDMTSVLFSGGPGGTFGMDIYDFLGWIYEGGGQALYNEFYQDVLKLNIVPFVVLRSCPQSFGWFKEPIKSWEDLKGKKCRIGGMTGEIFKRAGMSPVMLPGGEILPAAERGVIDCAEWVTPGEDMKMGFQDVWKYYYLPGVHENTSAGELLFNKDVWNDLPEDLKKIVEVCVTEVYVRWGLWFEKYNAEALVELKEKYGVHISETPEEILVKFLQAWDDFVVEENLGKILSSRR